MINFHIDQVMDVLGIQHSSGKMQENIPCPFCDVGKRTKHMNVNYAKDCGHCVSCGAGGGMLDFYIAFTGSSSRLEALKEINAALEVDEVKSYKPRAMIPVEKSELADVEARNTGLTMFLNSLTLFESHRISLRARGLTDEEIDRNGYKSVPVLSVTDQLRSLRIKGFVPDGIPGFYQLKNGDWNISKTGQGIYIPCRDTKGNIQGLQIRLDNTTERKYIWFSSADKLSGTRAKCFCHLTASDNGNIDEVIITEGPLKADVIHKYTGSAVLSVPGVNSLTCLADFLTDLKERGCYNVALAYDMDRVTNPNVQIGLENIKSILDKCGMSHRDLIWNPFYKGYDDYLHSIYSSCN